jgi:hypothetical protein
MGTFRVKMTPHGDEDRAEGSTLGQMSLEKEFEGDLDAQSKGEMLTAVTEVEGSAGYVAIERVTGTLHGRKGSFVLQHSGIMSGVSQQLTLAIVPDSANGELAGLSGSMTIQVVDGRHSYDIEYNLP